MTDKPVDTYFKQFKSVETTIDLTVGYTLAHHKLITAELNKTNISFLTEIENAKTIIKIKGET